jgi:hypothetical protein
VRNFSSIADRALAALFKRPASSSSLYRRVPLFFELVPIFIEAMPFTKRMFADMGLTVHQTSRASLPPRLHEIEQLHADRNGDGKRTARCYDCPFSFLRFTAASGINQDNLASPS